MKILRTGLAIVMLAFAFVQLNDPDALVWVIVYGAVAVLLALAAWRAPLIGSAAGRVVSLALTGAMVALVVLRWPDEAGFWRREIWWESESAREGMGLGIALLATLFVLPVAFRAGRRHPIAER